MVYQEKNNAIKIVMIVVISTLFLTAFVYITATIFKKEEKTKIIDPIVNIAEKVNKEKEEIKNPDTIPPIQINEEEENPRKLMIE